MRNRTQCNIGITQAMFEACVTHPETGAVNYTALVAMAQHSRWDTEHIGYYFVKRNRRIGFIIEADEVNPSFIPMPIRIAAIESMGVVAFLEPPTPAETEAIELHRFRAKLLLEDNSRTEIAIGA